MEIGQQQLVDFHTPEASLQEFKSNVSMAIDIVDGNACWKTAGIDFEDDERLAASALLSLSGYQPTVDTSSKAFEVNTKYKPKAKKT